MGSLIDEAENSSAMQLANASLEDEGLLENAPAIEYNFQPAGAARQRYEDLEANRPHAGTGGSSKLRSRPQ
jgi:hypothetical protein